MKILLVDIETAPSLAHVWSLWDQNIGLNQIERAGEVICLAAKWLDGKQVEFYSVHHHGRKRMVKEAHRLLDEADAVMHYNGTAFDLPWLNTEIVQAGLLPPSPVKEIDLWRVVKRKFNFPSNKLAYVAPALGLEPKVKHEGFELWRKCLAGDEKAWATMRQYNIQDVRLLEQLYGVLRPWIQMPSLQLHDGVDGCPTCGSGRIQSRGKAYTKVSEYRRFRCADCGSWFRATRRERGVSLTAV